MRREDLSRKTAISPIIATLLLILITVAAGVVVYAYVSRFIGNSIQNTGTSESTISIDNVCLSAGSGSGGTSCTGTGYTVTIRNLGTNTISYSGAVNAQLYFSDSSTLATGVVTCSLTGVSISPGGSHTCSGASFSPFTTTSGDTVVVKVVMPDGGSASGTTVALA